MFSLCFSWRFADGPCSLSCLYIQGNWRDQVLAWIYTLPGTVFFWWILMANSYSSIQLSDQASSLQEATSCSPLFSGEISSFFFASALSSLLPRLRSFVERPVFLTRMRTAELCLIGAHHYCPAQSRRQQVFNYVSGLLSIPTTFFPSYVKDG